MIPSRTQYPDFVPDQLLTSGNLNDMFGYLDEQGRMTRTNLLGIGILCGLEVRTAPDGTSIEVTKGNGVTSEGHLVAFDGTVDTRTFRHRVDFNPEKEAYYSKFLDAGHHKKLNLWELKRTAAGEGEVALTKSFLEGNGVDTQRKVVLAFVELLEEQNKNCSPENCDDKGVTVHVNLRFLLAERGAAVSCGLVPTPGPHHGNQSYATLPEVRIPRFDVTATTIQSAAGLLSAYRSILSPSFLDDVEHVLSDMWTTIKPLLDGAYQTTNPFATLAERFAFVHNGTINAAQLRSIQYVYDHFSDLIAAYEELRQTGMEVLGRCCPDSNLFPRHLMLDLAIPSDPGAPSEYRHRFRRSPLFEERDLLLRLRSQFRRLALMANDFHIPALPPTPTNPDGTIRITPSRLDPSPLSEKAIPFYYQPNLPAARPLYEEWSFRKTQASAARTNLSWHSGLWAAKDFVTNPLLYDLEPFNFLRIEGHVGKSFSQAIADLKAKVKSYRLPIDVVGVVLGTDASSTEIAEPGALRDIRIQYEVLRSEVVCCLKKQVEYWGRLKVREDFGYGKVDAKVAYAERPKMALRMLERDADPKVVERDEPSTPAHASPATGAAPASGSRTDSSGATAVAPTKLELIKGILQNAQENYLIVDYQGYQVAGNLDMTLIPDEQDSLDANTVSLHAMKIIDAIAELLVILEAEDPLSLDVDALSRRGEILERTIAKFLEKVDAELAVQRPLQKLHAYVGDSHADEIRRITRYLPDPTEEEVDYLILILNNLVDANTVDDLVDSLRRASTRAVKTSALREFASVARSDGDGVAMVAIKDVLKTGDPFLIALREKLRNFGCVCSLGGFAKLRQLLRDHLDDLRKLNLFSVFAADHPGLQHKGGVPFGGTFVVAYVRKGGASTDAADTRYKSVAAEFSDGLVVADFYLPYRIASNLPPVVFQVMESEQAPEVVTLALQPNSRVGATKYSVGDATAYAFTHSPNFGDLTNGTIANGVTTQGADNYVFTPSNAKTLLGNDLRKEIEFIYVKRGVSSAPVKVEIYNIPTATIALASNATGASTILPGASIAVQATSKFADTYRWMVQDGSGRSEQVGNTLNPGSLRFDKAGVYSLTLTAIQSATAEQIVSNTLRITVEDDVEQPVKTCGDLASILVAWNALEKNDAAAYKVLVKNVLQPLGIPAYFDALGKVAKKGVGEQTRFFAEIVEGKSFAAMMEAWTTKLRELLVTAKAGPERLLLLELYAILVNLILYVACARAKDLSADEAKLFSDLVAQIKGNGRDAGILKIKPSGQEKEVIARLAKEVADEVARNKINNKAFPKPIYARALSALAAAF